MFLHNFNIVMHDKITIDMSYFRRLTSAEPDGDDEEQEDAI